MRILKLYQLLVNDSTYERGASRLDGYNIRTFAKDGVVISFFYTGLLNKRTRVTLTKDGKIVTRQLLNIWRFVNGEERLHQSSKDQ